MAALDFYIHCRFLRYAIRCGLFADIRVHSWGFWWLDSVVSYITAFGMIYAMCVPYILCIIPSANLSSRMTRQRHSLEKMASVWILPVVTLIVASSTGGLLATALHPHSIGIAMLTTAISFTMLIMGLSLALMMITAYLLRLILHGPPDANLILSAFVVLGPLGQGGFSLLVNGENISKLLPLHAGDAFPLAPLTGQMLYSACFCGAWILWSMGIAWITIAICSIYIIARKEKIPFSMAYWGTIFPNGVFALLSVQLGSVLDSPFFHYFGAIWSSKLRIYHWPNLKLMFFAVLTLLLWCFVFCKTIPAILNTSIFKAPYITVSPKTLVYEAYKRSNLTTPSSQCSVSNPV